MTYFLPLVTEGGTLLNAKLEMHKNGVILHSRSGTLRNSDYRAALELTLSRLDQAQIAYSVHLDSRPVQGVPLTKRTLEFNRFAPAAERFKQLVSAMNAGTPSHGAWRRLLILTPGTKSAKLWRAVSGAGVVELLDRQTESDRLFSVWVGALIDGSKPLGAKRVIEGTGIIFTTSARGKQEAVNEAIVFGADSNAVDGVVKIVRPMVSQQGRGRLTAIGHDEQGRPLLLRQGWLKKNRISGEVRKHFHREAGLSPIVVSAADELSPRDWYVVADLSATKEDIVKATASFASACSLARFRTGGGTFVPVEADAYRLGLDEAGRTKKVTISGGTKEVAELQGYVWAELKRLIGSNLTKPTKHKYAVDAIMQSANLLIEIKTGVSARDVYEAVGQLTLYPLLIGLPSSLERVLLVSNQPPMRPQMAVALAAANIKVYYYSVGRVGGEPSIVFSPEFLSRCQSRFD